MGDEREVEAGIVGGDACATDHGKEAGRDVPEPWGTTEIARRQAMYLAGSNIAIRIDERRPAREFLAGG
jgi:hypothetical protein